MRPPRAGMILRMLQRLPNSFHILPGDSLYAQGPVFALLRRYGKHALKVLKDERPELFIDAQAFSRGQLPRVIQQGPASRQLDIEGFTSSPELQHPVRIAGSLESTRARERIAKQWRHTVRIQDRTWVTTLSQREAPTASIVRFGHARWQIESRHSGRTKW